MRRRHFVGTLGAGALIDAFGIFDLVADGGAETGRGAACSCQGKRQAAQFFAAVPHGLTAQDISV